MATKKHYSSKLRGLIAKEGLILGIRANSNEESWQAKQKIAEKIAEKYKIDADIPRIWTYYGDNGNHDNGNKNT